VIVVDGFGFEGGDFQGAKACRYNKQGEHPGKPPPICSQPDHLAGPGGDEAKGAIGGGQEMIVELVFGVIDFFNQQVSQVHFV
jgi:hypothetical protein